MTRPRFALLRAVVAAALFAFLGASAASAQPAEVVSITPGGVGFVEISSGAEGVSAQVGRWDTAYPNADTGYQAPGLEPFGASTLKIDVDVHDGGTVSFGYRFLTYDAGIYDWLDIYIVTPDGTVDLLSHFGKPGTAYGTYWESASIAFTKSLDAWRGKRVSFIFSVQQDGWGDQSAARVSNFAIRACRTPPLADLTDEEALRFESGDNIDTSRLNNSMKTALSCMQQTVAGRGGALTLLSAYRPASYQVHLREVWDRWKDLMNSRDPQCNLLREQVKAEFEKHDLQLTQRPAASSAHTRGEAFDASWRSLPSGVTIDALATQCLVYRPFIVNDHTHFLHR